VIRDPGREFARLTAARSEVHVVGFGLVAVLVIVQLPVASTNPVMMMSAGALVPVALAVGGADTSRPITAAVATESEIALDRRRRPDVPRAETSSRPLLRLVNIVPLATLACPYRLTVVPPHRVSRHPFG
jgi:hypothetical protein